MEGRLSKAAAIFNKLRPRWSNAACIPYWKLRVYDAVVLSVLYYGLQSVVFTQALKERVDYFQTKCLRQILRIKAAYYSKVSNREVLDQSSRILYGEYGKVKPISEIISDRAITLLGHIIRSDETDHMRKIAIDAEYKRVERAKTMCGQTKILLAARNNETRLPSYQEEIW